MVIIMWKMVMQSVDLWDLITLKEIHDGIELDSNIAQLPKDEGNIAWRAAQLIKQNLIYKKGFK